jgi:hypothetical protein
MQLLGSFWTDNIDLMLARAWWWVQWFGTSGGRSVFLASWV